MMIRSYAPTDLDELRRIHETYFKEEFDLPNFLKNYHCAFTVEEDRHVITIGGVRPIAEVISVTNKDLSVRVRREGLYKLLEASVFIARQYNYNQLHCFVQNERWTTQLCTAGFRPAIGNALVMDV